MSALMSAFAVASAAPAAQWSSWQLGAQGCGSSCSSSSRRSPHFALGGQPIAVPLRGLPMPGNASTLVLAGVLGLGAALGSRQTLRPRRGLAPDAPEMPLDQLVEVDGEYLTSLAPEKLVALQRMFPTLDVQQPGLRLVSEDPPIFILEDVISEETCALFVESMRGKDGQFPERLGQSNLPALPSWLGAAKTVLRGVPVLDWLGNPTVRWTYRSRLLLTDMLQKVTKDYGLDLLQGAANIKHYRQDQWLPVHIDYNHATMMAYLNDVGEGGHTLFPTLGIKVKPRKGSAMVWPNQPSLKHAGDRVTQGEKWVLFYNWPAEQNWEYDDNFDFND
ncbi:unnamed protein product [Polarella glacialis]|uniref:Prolyl 4-hydroxylase alpha subunit domain-containing protein n=1 Tax=Polarella glacialis TaxID=89957 RepID=A0A813LV86_POLGL|nr:unnamed protein product [Polarella glacialis]